MADFTTYWQAPQVMNNRGTLLDHTSGQRLQDVKPGDTIWPVHVRDGELFIVGRVRVEKMTDQAGAERLLKRRFWDAPYHAISQKAKAETCRLVALGEDTWKLTFISESSPTLVPKRGKVDAQQVRNPRKLTPESAAILNGIWESCEKVSVEGMPAHEKHSLPDVDDDVMVSGREGKKRWYKHLRRERNRSLVERKKKSVKAKTGELRCEACRFDFGSVFGPDLEDFCEVHHRNPLADDDDERDTPLVDLAILCANCHRAIHRLGPAMPSVEELAAHLRARK